MKAREEFQHIGDRSRVVGGLGPTTEGLSFPYVGEVLFPCGLSARCCYDVHGF